MSLFFSLTAKLIPFYLNILLGYIAGKKLEANHETIAKLMFYLISPIIIFNGVFNAHLDKSIFTLPILTFLISSSLCLIFYQLSRRLWVDGSKNLAAFSAGSGATGYFGIPLAMMIFNPETEAIYIMALLGVTLYDNSLGYYISAKNHYSSTECLFKLLKLPTLYAFLGGIIFNLSRIPMPDIYLDFIHPIKGVYAVMGMMIIGMGLSKMTRFQLDTRFIGMTFFAKFLVWPLIVFAIIALDQHYLGFYHPLVYKALTLIAIVPLAVNTVMMASLINCHPEKMAATVFLSTFFALIYIPLMVSLFLN